MSAIIFLILGLGGLWLGTEMVLRGAVSIARYFGLSPLFIGITILAVGTDLPELVISINAALDPTDPVRSSGLITGNSIGSCFGQISLVLGITALLGTIVISRKDLITHAFTLLAAHGLLFLLAWDGNISMVDGGVMILAYLVYYIALFSREAKSRSTDPRPKINMPVQVLLLIGGIVTVIFSSDLVVEEAVSLAKYFELPSTFVGIIMLGLGTSLPELAISLAAVIKKQEGLSIGNLLGSNIFDLLIPMGAGGMISGLTFTQEMLFFDLPALLGVSTIVLIFLFWKQGIVKWQGAILVVLFLCYGLLKFFT